MVSPLNHRLHRLESQIKTIFVLFSVLCSLFSNSYAESLRYIRVNVLSDVASLSLRVNGYYEIQDYYSQKVLYRGKNLKTTVTAYKDGILMGGKNFNTNKVFIKVDDPGLIVIDSRKFRGDMQFIKKDNANLSVINYIDLEDYIKGVLYHEASHYWPKEALKAQAIVCRTFALYQMQENASRDYDVTSDIYSQVYGGRTSERYRTNKAVEQTKGWVLTYQDKIFPAYYHATCAGHTEDASLIWNINVASLKGVPCDFCRDSPHFKWHTVLSQDEVKDKLINAGYKIDKIKDMVILGRDASGRITNLRITSDKNNIDISAKDFRNIIGPNIIRSTNFNINVVNHDVVFEGLGWGHGVGLCQWGAYFMAKQGYTTEQILKYYYPQADVKKY